jgi:hypothetical protein
MLSNRVSTLSLTIRRWNAPWWTPPSSRFTATGTGTKGGQKARPSVIDSRLISTGLSTGEASQGGRQAKLAVEAIASQAIAEGSLVKGGPTFSIARSSHSRRAWVPRYGAAIGENTPRYGAVLRVDWQDPAVSETGGHDQRLVIMELGEAGLVIGGRNANPAQGGEKAGSTCY